MSQCTAWSWLPQPPSPSSISENVSFYYDKLLHPHNILYYLYNSRLGDVGQKCQRNISAWSQAMCSYILSHVRTDVTLCIRKTNIFRFWPKKKCFYTLKCCSIIRSNIIFLQFHDYALHAANEAPLYL